MPRPADQTTEEWIANECLAVRVRLLNRVVTAIYDDALRPLEITAGQLNVLVAVAKLAPVSPGDIARTLRMEKSTVSRNLDRMRERGWLTVGPGSSGRSQLVATTRKGRGMLRRSEPRWESAQAQVKALLGRRRSEALASAADRVWQRD